jgi:PAS domain-containing protein
MTVMRDNIRQMMESEIAARRSAQSQLADAIEGARSGVALIGPDGRVLIANSRIRQFFPGRRTRSRPGRGCRRKSTSCWRIPPAKCGWRTDVGSG